VLTTEPGLNALIDLHVGDEANLTVIKDMQRDPVRRNVTHVDFMMIDRNVAMDFDIPVVVVGDFSKLEHEKGMADQLLYTLTVKAKPGAIPTQIDVDGTELGIGDQIKVGGKEFEVVGLTSTPLGGDASDVYLELGRLQRLSDREGRVNRIQVRATSSEAVAGLAKTIEGRLEGAEVVTAADLADRVGGSLEDAEKLSSKLGTALAIVALLAAFLIATLLTLSSVQKRIRELGTLKALGWRQRLVVRQVTGESLLQGALGGLLGAAIGIAGAAIIDAIGPTLEASVEQPAGAGFGPFGQGIVAGSTDVVLGAPVDLGLLALAVGLAIAGGLLAGAAGGLRAARLRPAEALRSAE
jgi:ABC-type lipoprotein release transport system permease subunit